MNVPHEDLSITVYPEKIGLGGQVVGIGPIGVRIEHLPTQTIAICQAHRSQHKNRKTAMDMIEYALLELGYATK